MGVIFGKYRFECSVCMYTHKFDEDYLLKNGYVEYVNKMKTSKDKECLECYKLTPDEKIQKHNIAYHELVIKPRQSQQWQIPSQYIPIVPL